MDPNNNQDQQNQPQQPLDVPQQPSPAFSPPTTSQQVPQPPAPQAPPLSSQPIGGQPAEYNPNIPSGKPIKKIIMGIVSLILIFIISSVGYGVYQSMQYPEENKAAISYIKALRDDDYEEIENLYDTKLVEIINREEDLAERIHAIDPSSIDPTTIKEDEYKLYLTTSEQDFSIPSGEPSRISVDYYGDTDPKYIVSIYSVGDEEVSVVFVYDGDKPKALFAKKGEYNDIKDFENAYKEYSDELTTVEQNLDKTESQIAAYEAQIKNGNSASSLSSKFNAQDLLFNN